MIVFKPKNGNLDYDKMQEKDVDKVKVLAIKCLKFKWIKNQTKNLNRILSPCAFCFDAKTNGFDCSKCKIPKIICNEDGNKGLIGFIFSKYGNIFSKDIDKKEYDLIRCSLIDLSKNGEISPLVKKKIENVN